MGKTVKMNLTEKEKKFIGCTIGLTQDLCECKSTDDMLKMMESIFSHSSIQLDYNNFLPKESYLFLTDCLMFNVIPYVYAKLKNITVDESLKILNDCANGYGNKLLEDYSKMINEENKGEKNGEKIS